MTGTGLGTWTCIQIERLIVESGRKIPPDPIPGTNFPGTWRALFWTDEAGWRRVFGPKDETGNLLPRPLTPEETSTMLRMTRQARASNHLLCVLETWGTLQYVLAPSLVFGWLWMLLSRNSIWIRALAVAGILLSATFGYFAFHRGYFYSLGN